LKLLGSLYDRISTELLRKVENHLFEADVPLWHQAFNCFNDSQAAWRVKHFESAPGQGDRIASTLSENAYLKERVE